MKTLFLLAGERSGDRHGAGLMEELQRLSPSTALHGLGGPEMRALSPNITDWVEEAGVVGLVEVLKKYPYFKEKLASTTQHLLTLNPDALVLIDYPGFNLRVAAALRARHFTGKIIYYISPQVWAWHRSRIPKMARLLDLMICIFPFEKDIYHEVGLPTLFAGHPLVQYHQSRRLHLTRPLDLIGLFPGSRRREITKHFPILLAAARLMQATHPNLTFIASAASEKLAALMQAHLSENPLANFTIQTGTVHTLMQQVTCGAVASGTATLEAAIHRLPHCLVYKVAWPTWLVGKALIRVPYLGIINLLAKKEIIRELIQTHCTPPRIAAELTRLHQNPAARAQLQQTLTEITQSLGGTAPYHQAASAILDAGRATA